jgi:hypothetical protein
MLKARGVEELLNLCNFMDSENKTKIDISCNWLSEPEVTYILFNRHSQLREVRVEMSTYQFKIQAVHACTIMNLWIFKSGTNVPVD